MMNLEVQLCPSIKHQLSCLKVLIMVQDSSPVKESGYIYTRIGNPTIHALETLVADLESGTKGIATSSGMAAVNTVYMALLSKGDHMISSAQFMDLHEL
jgi:O-acetylhomoserine/O-acetylserine sulfhydrylase-like pyridoxal-dependent enzyme